MISTVRNRWLKLTLKLGITGAILYLVFTFVPFAEVVHAIGSARPLYLVLGGALVLAGPFLSARRLKVLTDAQGLSFSASKIVGINFVAAFYGLVLPGQLAGGAIRWRRLWLLERKKEEILAALVYGRIIFLTVLCLMGLGFLLADLPRGVERGSIASLVVMLVFLAVVVWIGLRADRIRWLRRRASSTAGFASRLAAAAGSYRRLPRHKLAAVFAISTAENLVGLAGLMALAVSLDIEIAWITLGWVRSVVQAVTNLPLSISGLGIREGGMIVLLEPYGVSGVKAVALSFLMLARSLLLGAVGALLEARDLVVSETTTRNQR